MSNWPHRWNNILVKTSQVRERLISCLFVYSASWPDSSVIVGTIIIEFSIESHRRFRINLFASWWGSRFLLLFAFVYLVRALSHINRLVDRWFNVNDISKSVINWVEFAITILLILLQFIVGLLSSGMTHFNQLISWSLRGQTLLSACAVTTNKATSWRFWSVKWVYSHRIL